jgi:hypothetical protein
MIWGKPEYRDVVQTEDAECISRKRAKMAGANTRHSIELNAALVSSWYGEKRHTLLGEDATR